MNVLVVTMSPRLVRGPAVKGHYPQPLNTVTHTRAHTTASCKDLPMQMTICYVTNEGAWSCDVS